MNLPIRSRLTIWYIGVLAAVLLSFSAGVLWVQGRYSRMQFDAELASVGLTTASVLRSELAESHQLARAAAETRKAVDIPNRTVAILDAGGNPVAGHWRGFHRVNLPRPGAEPLMTTTVLQDAAPWRVRLQRTDSPDGAYYIVVAAAEAPMTREQRVLARTLLVAMPIALLLSAGICWWAASRALEPLTRMSEEAERITVHSLDSGLSTVQQDDEVGQLGRSFNRLLARVSAAVESQRQFMADASHELRTPLSAAQTAAEVTLAQPHREEEEYRDALEIVQTQTQRLGRMVDDMFVLARADAAGYRLRVSDGFADEMLIECAEAARVLAAAQGIALDVALEPAIPLRADEALIGQLALNLLENAIKHTPAGGRVRLELRRVDAWAQIAVVDSGSGIPPADRARIFERFVRLDEARENVGGAGLGLPIARWIAESHGGTLMLQSSGPQGSTFLVRLPLAGRDGSRLASSTRLSAPAVPHTLSHPAVSPSSSV
ncbi:MAG: cusS [Acidobacteria bacterium]|nr:cusS [Acidobacteriota bacterium]